MAVAPSTAHIELALHSQELLRSSYEFTPKKNLIWTWIQQKYITPTPITNSKFCISTTRVVLKVAAPILSIWGNFYYIPVNMQAARHKLALGVVLNIGNGSSVVALNTWSLYGILDEYVNNATEVEKALKKSHLSTCAKTSTIVSAFALGILSQVAVAYVAYISNEHKLLPALVLFAPDSPFPIYSSICSLRDLIAQKKTDAEKALCEFQKKAATVLTCNHENFLRKSQQGKLAGLAEFEEIIKHSSPKDALLSKLYELYPQKKVLNCSNRWAEHTVFGLGLIFAAAHQALVARIGYQAGQHYFGDEVAGYFSGAVVGSANLYLSGLSASTTSRDLFRTIRDLATGKYLPSLAAQLHPYLATSLKLTGLLLSSLSYGASVGMVEDAFDPGYFEKCMEVVVSGSWAFITLKAFNDLSDVILDIILSNSSCTQDQRLSILDQFMRQHIDIVGSSSPADFAEYVLDLPDSVLDKLTLNRQQLIDLANECLDLGEDLSHLETRTTSSK